MHRTKDVESFDARLHEPDLGRYYENFDTASWLGDDHNVVFQEGDSFGVFAYEMPHVYTAHYMFRKEHRGKEARELSLKMLREMRKTYGAYTIRGLIDVDNRPSRLMTRLLRFTSYGIIEGHHGPCEIFCLDLNERFKDEIDG